MAHFPLRQTVCVEKEQEAEGMSMSRDEKLSKAFGSLQVLKDVNLTVEKGERIVIIGGSGCGKSVFLRCMGFSRNTGRGSCIHRGG